MTPGPHNAVCQGYYSATRVGPGPLVGFDLCIHELRDSKFLLIHYTDDMSILAPLALPATRRSLQVNLNKIDCWTSNNLLRLSVAKNCTMCISSSHSVEKPSYILYGAPVTVTDSATILGVYT